MENIAGTNPPFFIATLINLNISIKKEPSNPGILHGPILGRVIFLPISIQGWKEACSSASPWREKVYSGEMAVHARITRITVDTFHFTSLMFYKAVTSSKEIFALLFHSRPCELLPAVVLDFSSEFFSDCSLWDVRLIHTRNGLKRSSTTHTNNIKKYVSAVLRNMGFHYKFQT